MTIHKYPFKIADRITLLLPSDHRILKVDRQYNQSQNEACLWAFVNPDSKMLPFPFRIFGTGHPIDPVDVTEYVATWQAQPFVWHMFRSAS